MELSKNSWHFKLVRHCYNRPARSLCEYCRQVVFSGVMYALVTSIVGVLVIWNLAAIVLLFQGASTVEDTIGFFAVFSVTFGTIIALGIIALFAHYQDRKRRKYYNRMNNNLPEPEPSLIVARYRAWKDKVCPTIEFKD